MTDQILFCINRELSGARQKFPSNNHLLDALADKVEELAQALIDHDRGRRSSAEVYAEAVQVAAMAIRIAEEGSEEFRYRYSHSDSQVFIPTGSR